MARFIVPVLLIGLPLLTVEARAETEAETAARTERKVTNAEYDRLVRDCALPARGTPLAGFPADLDAVRVKLPTLTFLPAIHVTRNETDPTKADVSAYPALPNGGIGRRDYCDSVILARIRPAGTPMQDFMSALRLRPGLDIENDYPTAFAEMVQREQFMEIAPASYAGIPVPPESDVEEVLARIATSPQIRMDAFYFEIDHVLYVPLLD